jgi:hypothetical protein
MTLRKSRIERRQPGMINLKFTPSDQESIESEIKKVSKNRREILRLIHEATFARNMNETGRITTVIARFATLLVSLSEQADSIQKEIIWFNRIIAFLTLVLTLLTLVLLFK